MKTSKLVTGIIILLCIGFLCGNLYGESKVPSYEGLTKDYFNTARGCFIGGNVVCYDYSPQNGKNTQAHEEVHMLINTNSDTCVGGCRNHFCGRVY